MGLEKLKSIFNAGVGTKVVDYFENPPEGFTKGMDNLRDSQLTPGGFDYIPPKKMISTFGDFPQTPILSSLKGMESGFTRGISVMPGIKPGDSPLAHDSAFPILDKPEFFNFVADGRKLYNSRNYDPRSDVIIKNVYKGTRFDDDVGGLFNQTTNYSDSSFLTINTPTLDDIMTGGNINTGAGYPEKRGLYNRWLDNKPIFQNKYFVNGEIGETWFQHGKFDGTYTDGGDTYPVYNYLTKGMGDTPGGMNERSVALGDTKLVAPELGKGKLKFNTMYNVDQTVNTGKRYSYSRHVNLDHSLRKPPTKTFGARNFRTISSDSLLAQIVNKAQGIFGQIQHVDFGSKDPITGGAYIGGGLGEEPYVISKIGGDTGLRDTSNSSRYWPSGRSIKDIERLGKFFMTPAGDEFMKRQAALVLMSDVVYVNTDGNLVRNRDRHPLAGYGPWNTLASAASNLFGQSPNLLLSRQMVEPKPFKYEDTVKTSFKNKTLADSFMGPDPLSQKDITSLKLWQKAGEVIKGQAQQISGFGRTLKEGSKGGDVHTLYPIKQIRNPGSQTMADVFGEDNVDIGNATTGMPFYFRDLRDHAVVTFRAYLEGLTESVTPTWTPQLFLGRSEPSYMYERAERQVDFTLKHYAQTHDELIRIWQKLNRLNSMCYPSYFRDPSFNDLVGTTDQQQPGDNSVNSVIDSENVPITRPLDGKLRMKPPLVQMRLGNIYGNESRMCTGFMKSLVNTFPDGSPWEALEFVPLHVVTTLSFQIIHGEVPNLDFASGKSRNGPTFYGITDSQHYDTGLLRSDYRSKNESYFQSENAEKNNAFIEKAKKPYNLSSAAEELAGNFDLVNDFLPTDEP